VTGCRCLLGRKRYTGTILIKHLADALRIDENSCCAHPKLSPSECHRFSRFALSQPIQSDLPVKHISPPAQVVPFSPGPKSIRLPQPPNRPSILPSWAWQLWLLCTCDMLAQHSNPRPHLSSLLPKPKLRRLLRRWGHPMSLLLGARVLVASYRDQSHRF
jgi:hypothetical protein